MNFYNFVGTSEYQRLHRKRITLNTVNFDVYCSLFFKYRALNCLIVWTVGKFLLRYFSASRALPKQNDRDRAVRIRPSLPKIAKQIAGLRQVPVLTLNQLDPYIIGSPGSGSVYYTYKDPDSDPAALKL